MSSLPSDALAAVASSAQQQRRAKVRQAATESNEPEDVIPVAPAAAAAAAGVVAVQHEGLSIGLEKLCVSMHETRLSAVRLARSFTQSNSNWLIAMTLYNPYNGRRMCANGSAFHSNLPSVQILPLPIMKRASWDGSLEEPGQLIPATVVWPPHMSGQRGMTLEKFNRLSAGQLRDILVAYHASPLVEIPDLDDYPNLRAAVQCHLTCGHSEGYTQIKRTRLQRRKRQHSS